MKFKVRFNDTPETRKAGCAGKTVELDSKQDVIGLITHGKDMSWAAFYNKDSKRLDPDFEFVED